MAVRAAATLGVADQLARGLDNAAELAGATGADAGALDRLLAHLVTVGVLRRDPPDRYALTELGEALRADRVAAGAGLGTRAVDQAGDLSVVELAAS
jgi:DNA-binding IclR family transcriptional regulator